MIGAHAIPLPNEPREIPPVKVLPTDWSPLIRLRQQLSPKKE